MFIETGKGNIYYEVNGEGPGVLFLHGLGGSLDSMYPIGESLKSYKRIYVDIPCHGKSDNFEINFDDISTFLVDLMKKLGLEKFYIVGISLGSLISENLIIKHPDNVIKGVFISPSSHIDENAMRKVFSWFNSEDGGTSTLFSKNFYETHKKEIMEYEKSHPLKTERLFYISNEIMKFNILNERSEKRCAIIYGEYDDLFGERMLPYLKSVFLNCEIFKLNAGHAIHRESPQDAAIIIERFFEDP